MLGLWLPRAAKVGDALVSNASKATAARFVTYAIATSGGCLFGWCSPYPLGIELLHALVIATGQTTNAVTCFIAVPINFNYVLARISIWVRG